VVATPLHTIKEGRSFVWIRSLAASFGGLSLESPVFSLDPFLHSISGSGF
jgi:hypothetical protein